MTGQDSWTATLESRLRHWLTVAMGWRDWRVPAKLVAVTAVPVVFVVALGIVQIQAQIAQADQFATADRQVAVNEQVRAALTALQQERDGAAEYIADGRVADPARVRQQAATSDAALAAVTASIATTRGIDATTTAVLAPMHTKLDRLALLRMHLLAGQVDAGIAVTRYTEVIGSVLDLERALISGFSDATLSRAAAALFDVSASEEEVYFQQSLVTAGIGRGELAPDEQQFLKESDVRLSSRMADFRVVADPADQQEYQRVVSGPLVDQRTQLEQLAVNAPTGLPGQPRFPVAQHAWTVASDATTFQLRTVSDWLTARLRGTASTQQNQASSVAGFNAVALFSALLIVAAIAFAIARQLVNSLGLLRRTALDIATDQLPTEVATIRDGDDAEIVVAPVPVYTKEEVGEVARAFDEVHLQALRLAAEQTTLRRSYNNVFVNLSRRSQSLVERQLTLFEALERDEEDPSHLSTLFQLDHLATRMRRNNENLMVLSGGELARRFTQPVPLTDLLRAAISEIEHYPRVLLRTTTSARVVGHAASDVLRLLAELMDNAANFSPPKNKVTVATYPNPAGSITVDILDRGIGMTEEEAEAANERLITAPEIDVSASRRMGLFVVGRLAGRHGITVRLFASQSLEGVRAAITLPSSIIAADGPVRVSGGGALPAATPADLGPDGPSPAEASPRSGHLAGLGEQRSPADNTLPWITSGAATPSARQSEGGSAQDGATAESAGESTLLSESLTVQSDAADDIDVIDVIDDTDETDEIDDTGEADAAQEGEDWPGRGVIDNRFRVVADLFTLGAADEFSAADPARLLPDRPTPDFSALADRLHVSPPWQAAEAADDAEPDGDLFAAGRDTADDAGPGAGGGDRPANGVANDTVAIARSSLPGADSAAGGRVRATETTPIFDALAPAWFQESRDTTASAAAHSAAPSRSVPAAGPDAAREWHSAADAGWRAVDEAAQPEPAELTTAGLPRRVRGARLLPGSVTPSTPSAAAERDPSALRGRLSSLQRGLYQARHRAVDPPTVQAQPVVPAPGTTAEPADSAPQPTAPASTPTPAQAQAQAGKPGPARRDSLQSVIARAAAAAQTVIIRRDPSLTANSTHSMASDGEATSAPDASTTSGEPADSGPVAAHSSRQERGDQQADTEIEAATTAAADPADTAETEAAVEGDAASGTGPDPAAELTPHTADADAATAADAASTTDAAHERTPQDRAEISADAAEADWRGAQRAMPMPPFAAGPAPITWREPVPQPPVPAPEALTSAGLPRRVPRARLRPGSMPDPEQPGTDPERNAELMRGRLSSFQRGVQRGRRARGSAASTVLERRQEKE